ncbi:MAG: hypothetical protein B6I34_02815 [Anaerolineaceae bacterium 4572_32.1]|nr:MAG: hypothetical protein B6I34_02815 [Anaerolineaceae bacterium 4572_32.1]
MNPVTHGLVLTALGMGLVFLALGIFLASMVLLTRLFPEREKKETTTSTDPGSPSEDEMAAIGAALSIWLAPERRASDPQLGAALSSGPSPWGVAARGQAFNGGYND